MTTQHTMRDPIHEAFAEHRRVLAQRDELVAALRFVVEQAERVPMMWEKGLDSPERKANEALAAIKFNARAALAKIK